MIKNQVSERIFPLIEQAQSIGVNCESYIFPGTGILIELIFPEKLGGRYFKINLCNYTDFDLCQLESELFRTYSKFLNLKASEIKKSILDKLTEEEVNYLRLYHTFP